MTHPVSMSCNVRKEANGAQFALAVFWGIAEGSMSGQEGCLADIALIRGRLESRGAKQDRAVDSSSIDDNFIT